MVQARKNIAAHIAAIVRTNPNPPRLVQWTPLVIGTLQQSSMKVFIGIGLIFAVCGAGALMFDSSLHGGASWVMGFMMVTGMFLLSAPFIRIWRIHGALSQGHLGAAEVLRVVYSQPGATDTLDSIQNGIARGTWQLSQATLF